VAGPEGNRLRADISFDVAAWRDAAEGQQAGATEQPGLGFEYASSFAESDMEEGHSLACVLHAHAPKSSASTGAQPPLPTTQLILAPICESTRTTPK